MPAVLFEKGREGFGNAAYDWVANNFKEALLDLSIADTGIKAVTGATNATPIVITATAHGFANGDLVVIGNVAGNLAANGYWKIANQATNTFELTDPVTGANAVGSAAYSGSGGYAICLGPSGAGDFWNDFDGAVVGTPQAIASKTMTSGVADAASPITWTAVTAGNIVRASVIYQDTGTNTTSRMIKFNDGRQIVTCAAAAASSATTVAVERLPAGIPTGTVLTFSDGKTATLSALANAGDRTITVSALASSILAGARSDAPRTGAGLPITTNGGNITNTFDSGPSKVFKL